ncbi:MAG TPA: methyltransferase domain-containing protein [Burkholderiales bacterium]|nr:methyltransferase domain-containing protein [Burkholderiales bacterium]
MTQLANTAEMEALKAALKATWTAGNFGRIAKSYQPEAVEFIRRLDPQPGTRVLDVACGTGNLTLPAARLAAMVTGVDIAPNLLSQARERAAIEGLPVQFDEGDAEQLPYDDSSFDTLVSMFGVMFAPRPERVVSELFRVCRSGGKIALASWTPEGFIGRMFRTVAEHVPPPADIPSPLQWGVDDEMRERLSGGASEVSMNRRLVSLTFPFSPPEVVEYWRLYYGPASAAFEALAAPARQAALRRALEQLWSAHNQASDGTTRVESEYLEILATRS